MHSRPGACRLGFPLAGLLASCTEDPDCAEAASRTVAPCGHSLVGVGVEKGEGHFIPGLSGAAGPIYASFLHPGTGRALFAAALMPLGWTV